MPTLGTIEQLRRDFSKFQRMDPEGPVYQRLCAILDRADNDALRAAYEANIPFVSSLALNRMIRRKIPLKR